MFKHFIKPALVTYFCFLLVLLVASGQPPSEKVIDLDKGDEQIRILGDDTGDHSGFSVSSGDINGDGYADVIIGAPIADPAGRSAAGETYVIFGSAAPPATIDLNSVSADMTIYGDDAADESARSVSSGDINGDGYADVIIGAPDAVPAGGTEAGETYVIFGSAAPLATVDLNSVSADMTIYGDDAGDKCGWSISSCDINGDGYADVIIGAYAADPAGGADAGETYVIFGSAAPPATVDLNSVSADMTISGDDAGLSGISVSSGDINGDGYADVIIGAPRANPAGGNYAGETYVIFGSAAPPATVDLNSVSADMTIYGDDVGDWSGRSVSSADINGDGCDDVIIGAPEADPAGRNEAGETYVIFGSGLPIDYDFFDTDISDWQRKRTGVAKVIDEQLMLRRTSNNFRLFPKGALAEKCTIEAKVTRAGGRLAKVSSSIFFSYKDNRNFWELRMQLYSVSSKKTGEWILLRRMVCLWKSIALLIS